MGVSPPLPPYLTGMANVILDPIMIVLDGKGRRELSNFGDLLAFVAPADDARPCGIGKTMTTATTAAQQEVAIAKFRSWITNTGLLVGIRIR